MTGLAVSPSVLIKRTQVRGKITGGALRVGMVLAQHAAFPGQGVFVQFACCLVLAERTQGNGEVAGCQQSGGVVVTQDAP